ncbi:hypothetical protein [Bdellovibrio svalbardensis]|uniref:Novel toxin 16 domain-containing protein n=1 Tax=Bdellovibrio svalbardensis TaxID=2972972 RepID=A0ABT6DJJ3_9BACT|nr:hypothetical protein [Bdellovibrio svalbardensis]MDG0817027.1 hypothetical protein [Bdellovibrio svalbardensis]
MRSVLVLMMIVGQSAFALDMGDLQNQGSKLAEQAKAKAQVVAAACKEDKVKYCEKYNEMEALKACFNTNKASLSTGCKTSLGMK